MDTSTLGMPIFTRNMEKMKDRGVLKAGSGTQLRATQSGETGLFARRPLVSG
jgi:hypothetical protein